MDQPLVSIVTPTFNSERHIAQCVSSVCAQTYKNWELFVVDDGSTDRTLQIVAQFADKRINVIPLQHRGIRYLAETHNAALQVARGELVALLDGDDRWPRRKLEDQIPLFRDSELKLSWGRAVVIDEHDRPIFRWPYPPRSLRSCYLPDLFKALTLTNVLTPTVTVMVRRSALERVGGFRSTANAPFVDWPTWLAISAAVDGKSMFTRRTAGYYRFHAAQTSKRFRLEMHTEQREVVREMLDTIGEGRLRELGWNAAIEQRSVASAKLRRGVALSRDGRSQAAIDDLTNARDSTLRRRHRLRAQLALVSRNAGFDLLAPIESIRRRLSRLGLTLAERRVE